MNLDTLLSIVREFKSEPSGEEVAEALWFMLKVDNDISQFQSGHNNSFAHVPSEEPISEGPQQPELDTDPDSEPNNQSGSKTSSERQKLKQSRRASLVARYGTNQSAPVQRGGLPVNIPAPPSLPDALNIARALRPLRRRVDSRTSSFLDERATTQRTADERILVPVLRPQRTRWLSIDLVVDASETMLLWRPTVVDFLRLLARQGAFRDVRLWSLNTRSPIHPPHLYAGLRYGRGMGSSHSLNELIDPTGSRLVLVMSDCVAPGWHGGMVAQAIARWGARSPVAIIQVLPDWLWDRTSLGREAGIEVQGLQPGQANTRLQVRLHDDWLEELDQLPTGIPIPVLSLDAQSVTSWARFMVGSTKDWIRGVMLSTIERRVPFLEQAPELDAESRLRNFYASASLPAQALAERLSVAPLTLPVINLVQHAARTGGNQANIAEVLFGGLARQVTPTEQIVSTDEILFEFFPGVREALFMRCKLSESYPLIETISNYIEEARRIRTMRAAVAGIGEGQTQVPVIEDLPFAKARAMLLRSIGYEQAAELLEQHISMQQGETSLTPGEGEEFSHTYSDIEDKEPYLIVRDLARRQEVFPQHPLYQQAQPDLTDVNRLAEAQALLKTLPLDNIPEGADLPSISRMPLERNPQFVGRERMLRQIASNIQRHITTVIAGPSGTGKTQVVTEFVYHYGSYFTGGVFWLECRDPQAVMLEIATCGDSKHLALRPDFSVLPLQEQVRLVLSAWQSDMPRLLVFHDCETEELLGQWEPLIGGTHVLVTSQYSDWNPALQVETLRLEVPLRAESIVLLRSYRPDLSDDEADTLASLLGDLPLAIHLAGSYLKKFSGMSAADYLADLAQHRLDHPTLVGREVNLFAAFRRSLDKLDPAHAAGALARTLLAFVAGLEPPATTFSHALLAAVAPIKADALDTAVLVEEAIGLLLNLGLIEREAGERMRMHRLIRNEVVHAQLEPDAFQRCAPAALAFCAAMIERGDDCIVGGQIVEGRSLLDQERALWQQFLDWGAIHEMGAAGISQVARATGRLRNYWNLSDAFTEAATLTCLQQAQVAATRAHDHWGEASVRKAMGDVWQFRDERDAALEAYQAALGLFRQVGDRLGEANVCKAMGDVWQFRKEMDAALVSYDQARSLFRQVGDRLGEANVCKAMGDVWQFQKQMDRALEAYYQALDLFGEVGDRLGEANVCKAMGDVRQFHKDMEAALAAYYQALDLFGEVGDRLGEANVRKTMGDVWQFRDDQDAALASYHLALELYHQVGSRLGEANVQNAIGDVYRFRDERDAALVSYDKALVLYRQVGSHLGEANIYAARGQLELIQSNQIEAEQFLAKAIHIYESIGDQYSIAVQVGNYGWILRRIGRYQDASSYFLRASAHFAALGLDDEAQRHRHAAQDMRFANAHALLIGVGTYCHAPQFNVPISAADAHAVAEVLSDPHYCGYPAEQVTLLINETASREGILAALDALVARVSADDMVFLFFCGLIEYGDDGDYYLTTHDTRFGHHNVVSGAGVSLSALAMKLRNLRAKRSLFVINAFQVPEFMAAALLGLSGERIIITACREGQASFIGSGPLTLFTQALVDGLKGKGGSSNRRYINIFDLYTYLYSALEEAVKREIPATLRERYGGKQEPELSMLNGVRPFAVALYHGATTFDASGGLPDGMAVRQINPAYSQAMLRQHQQQISGNAQVGTAIAGDIHGDVHVNQQTDQSQRGVVNFGSGGRFGDIKIGDIAGRDIIRTKITHSDQITTGDISGIAIGRGAQSSVGTPHGDAATKAQIHELLTQLNAELQKVPPAHAKQAEEAAKRAESAVAEATKPNPDKDDIEYILSRLKKAAENIAQVLPTVLPIATKIALVIRKMIPT